MGCGRRCCWRKEAWLVDMSRPRELEDFQVSSSRTDVSNLQRKRAQKHRCPKKAQKASSSLQAWFFLIKHVMGLPW